MFKYISGSISVNISGVSSSIDSTYNTGEYYLIPIYKYITDSLDNINISISLTSGRFYISDIKILEDKYGISYEYDNYTNIVRQISNSGIISYSYINNLCSQESYDGINTSYTYDNNKNLIKQERTNLATINMTYDSNNRLISKIITNGNTIIPETYEYNDLGIINKTTNELFEQSNYTYNSDGSIKELGLSTRPSMKYEYDDKGRIAKLIELTAYISDNDPARNINLNYTYSGMNLRYDKVEMKNSDPIDTSTINTYYEIEYDNDGNLTKLKQEGNINQSNSYNEKSDIKKESYSQNSYKEYTYEKGNLKTISINSNLKTTINYNDNNEVINILDNNITTSYKYDNLGRIIEKSNPNQTNYYQYNNKNQLIIETNKVGDRGNLKAVYLRKDNSLKTTLNYNLDNNIINYQIF
ncbi:MAG: hypothetical protein ACI35S_00875, partial [Anaeroplasma sp.]